MATKKHKKCNGKKSRKSSKNSKNKMRGGSYDPSGSNLGYGEQNKAEAKHQPRRQSIKMNNVQHQRVENYYDPSGSNLGYGPQNNAELRYQTSKLAKLPKRKSRKLPQTPKR